ncbi:MAG: LysM peptidoglycan-binding domain-containing protein [Bacteroides sp.]|nr:LysM peptidoglycan-binding domain-containing protein [Bacteroides sp.]
MKKQSWILLLLVIAAFTLPLFAAEPKLPKVEILGKEYYYHEIKKGESLYGIAKQYGWDLNELVRLNPNTTSEMEKGARLYYPIGKETVVAEPEETSIEDSVSYEPISHVVKKGETVYSISRQYNIPLETIYASHPQAKYGIKAGETIVIQQSPQTVNGKYLFYVIKSGDTLYSLAKKYKTTIEDILKANPGVSQNNFRIGDTVRIAVNSNSQRTHTELVEEERVASIDSYKVKKDDTWKSIAKNTGVTEEVLKNANEDVRSPKKNEVINVPVIETVQVEKQTVDVDPRELESGGIEEIYDSVHNVNSEVKVLEEVKIALLSDEPTSKKDLEFARGFLIALEGMKDSPYKINFKIIDGRGSTESVINNLDDFEPNLIVATADKAFPAFLADYGNTNNVEIVNVFDVKNELYEDNPSMVQLLPSSAYFNEQIADRIYEEYGDRELILVGRADENDGIAELLIPKFDSSKVKKVSLSALSDYTVTDNGSYLIYAYPSKKEEVSDVMRGVVNLKENAVVAPINVIGRQSWVTFIETLGDKFSEAGVIIPARLWLDSDSREGKRFNEQYAKMFDGTPIKSFPNFAASGYDVAKYFIPSTAKNGGDFNKGFSNIDGESLQTDIRLQRVNNWGGFFNPSGYLLKFRPGGYVDKDLIR